MADNLDENNVILSILKKATVNWITYLMFKALLFDLQNTPVLPENDCGICTELLTGIIKEQFSPLSEFIMKTWTMLRIDFTN